MLTVRWIGRYEQLLARERDDKVKLRGEAGIHKKHHEELKKHMHKKDEEIRSRRITGSPS